MSEINFEFFKKIMLGFKDWLKTEEGKEFAADRDKKDLFIKTYFTPSRINDLDEGVLRARARQVSFLS